MENTRKTLAKKIPYEIGLILLILWIRHQTSGQLLDLNLISLDFVLKEMTDFYKRTIATCFPSEKKLNGTFLSHLMSLD